MSDNNHTGAPEPSAEPLGSGRASLANRIFARTLWSFFFLAVGVVTTPIGLLTAFSGFGFIFLFFAPLWFALAAVLRPTRWRIVAACFVAGCWIVGALHVIF